MRAALKSLLIGHGNLLIESATIHLLKKTSRELVFNRCGANVSLVEVFVALSIGGALQLLDKERTQTHELAAYLLNNKIIQSPEKDHILLKLSKQIHEFDYSDFSNYSLKKFDVLQIDRGEIYCLHQLPSFFKQHGNDVEFQLNLDYPFIFNLIFSRKNSHTKVEINYPTYRIIFLDSTHNPVCSFKKNEKRIFSYLKNFLLPHTWSRLFHYPDNLLLPINGKLNHYLIRNT